MTENEMELLDIVRGSEDPALVAEYMLNLFLDYLRTHGLAQDISSAIPQESA